MRLTVLLTLGLMVLPPIAAGQEEKKADPRDNLGQLSMLIQIEATGSLHSTSKPELGIVLKPAKPGVKIVQVLPGSAAAKSGLKVDDIILKWDGAQCDDPSVFTAQVQKLKPKDEMKLKVNRDGKEIDIVAIPGESRKYVLETNDRVFSFASGGKYQKRPSKYTLNLTSTKLSPEDLKKMEGEPVRVSGSVELMHMEFNTDRAGETRWSLGVGRVISVRELAPTKVKWRRL